MLLGVFIGAIVVFVCDHLNYGPETTLTPVVMPVQDQESTDGGVAEAPKTWDTLATNTAYQDPGIEHDLVECLGDKYDTISMDTCSEQAMNAYDARLNTVYQLLIPPFTEDARVLGELAQEKTDGHAEAINKVKDISKSFENYRSVICGAAYDSAEGGTIRGSLYAGCYMEVTKAQIQALCQLGSVGSVCTDKIPLY